MNIVAFCRFVLENLLSFDFCSLYNQQLAHQAAVFNSIRDQAYGGGGYGGGGYGGAGAGAGAGAFGGAGAYGGAGAPVGSYGGVGQSGSYGYL